MKRNFLALLAVGAALGCAERGQVSLLPVGPAPQMVADKVNDGTLVVYSAWRKTGTDDPDHRLHSDYEVLTSEAKPFMHVRNYVTPMIDDPATLRLTPGKYVVKARVQRYGFVLVPVVIESSKTTVLYLDDTTKPGEGREAAEKVQLPDGRVVGWASAAAR